jgi:hypothetical protein
MKDLSRYPKSGTLRRVPRKAANNIGNRRQEKMANENISYEDLLKENVKLKERVSELEKYISFNQSKSSPLSDTQSYQTYFSNASFTFDLDDLKSHSALTKEQIERYSRQLLIPEIGVKGTISNSITTKFQGQLQLAKSSVLIVGAGGLGAPTSLYLAAAGVGKT